MVDYSKWDKLEVSSDEDSTHTRHPRVHRLQEKQKVTIGPSGLCIGEESGPAASSSDGKETRSTRPSTGEPPKIEEVSDEEDNLDDWDEEMANACGGNPQADDAYEDAHEWPRCGFLPPAEVRHRDGQRPQLSGEGVSAQSPRQDEACSALQSKRRDEELLLIQNGGVVEGRYIWSQTKHEVTVDVRLPPEARGKDVKVTIKEDSCLCTYKGQVVLGGSLCHKVEEDEDMWLWELVERKVNWRRLARVADVFNRQAEAREENKHSGKDEGREESSGKSKPAGSASRRTVTSGAEAPGRPRGEKAGEDSAVHGEDKKHSSGSVSVAREEGARDSAAIEEGKMEEEEEEKAQTEVEGGAEEKTMFLEINLRKKPEIANTFVWWDCIVKVSQEFAIPPPSFHSLGSSVSEALLSVAGRPSGKGRTG